MTATAADLAPLAWTEFRAGSRPLGPAPRPPRTVPGRLAHIAQDEGGGAWTAACGYWAGDEDRPRTRRHYPACPNCLAALDGWDQGTGGVGTARERAPYQAHVRRLRESTPQPARPGRGAAGQTP